MLIIIGIPIIFIQILLFIIGMSMVLVSSEFPCCDGYSTWSEAEPSPEIKMADSDFWDDDNDGIFDDDVEEAMPDKLSDVEEYYIYGTDPYDPDSDDDGMMDGWEVFYRRWNPFTGNYTIDPNVPDGGENPDGDGLDLSRTGVLNAHHSPTAEWDGGENFTNLEEYCGGKIENLIEDVDRLLTIEREQLLKDIASRGGFHLCENYMNPATKENFTYEEYNPWQQRHCKDPIFVTTNPSSRDSDGDGMGDNYEVYHGATERPGTIWGGAKAWRGEVVFQYNYSRRTYDEVVYNYSLNPLDPSDAEYDMDLFPIRSYSHVPLGGGWEIDMAFVGAMELRPDGLTNIDEYWGGTDPMNWDTDNDTFLRPDGSELANDDGWEICGDLNPTDPDMDGDDMPDGWERYYGMDPTNSSDRFLDLDGDGLRNTYEYEWGTDPLNPDTDNDGLPDGWEVLVGLDPTNASDGGKGR